LIAAQFYLIEWALLLVQPSVTVAELTHEYFNIRIWSAPATLLTYVLLGWFLGIQKARLVLYVMVFINLLNIALDLLFVVGLGLTVQGVAFASLISEYAGLLLAIYLIAKEVSHLKGSGHWFDTLDWLSFRRLLSLNFDIFIRTITLLFVFAFFTTQSARAGDVVMAANAVLLQFITFMAYVLDAYAHAAEAMVGEALGHKNKQRLIQTVNTCMKWSLASALIFMVFYLIVGEYILALLTDIKEVKVFANQYVYWLALMPLVAVWGYLFDGVFVGAIWSREMRNVMLMAVFFVYLPVWLTTQSMHNHGLWLSLFLFLTARGGLMAWYYQKKLVNMNF
jgi:MATE family, multidrug efflux pump